MCSNSKSFFVQPLQVAGHHELAADDAGLVRAALLGRCLLSWITLAPARKVMTALGHFFMAALSRLCNLEILNAG
jgi:small neutral amino acid transporter SnatA (MarC family)